MNVIYEPWPWYVGGPLIALILFLLLFAGKKFGMSSNLRTTCAAMGAEKVADYFNYDWKSKRWNLMVVLGAAIGGFIASNYMGNSNVEINPDVAEQLAKDYKITSAGEYYMPPEIFSIENLGDPFNIAVLLLGGILVGFGARYGGGCTSGHGISGLSNLQLPSLIAVIGFFIGGIIMVHLLYPLIFA
ncbi:YeeE/YedE family protein [Mariniflexile sp. AS56]|uniref:YeeE/YedE family protein n=1 Tax=Mariniflexile sp. AS56 TaxID=3063957 RepID=UPI0026E9DC49|nr:YeeE/YedE thiosulfate transporter family protein [Mariniflexile sp. AS56]MDO7173854.1 YeeE/YedE thiosulfate transporter family protein [Mariniflexile sp. AS56]